ncbi:unnamed protein product [Agarophyton chilense]
MSVEDRACTDGRLQFTTVFFPNTLPFFMSAQPHTRHLLLARVQDKPLLCGRFRFDQLAAFTFLSTARNVSVTWSNVFATVNTTLAHALGSERYTFVANQIHLLIKDQCLYTRITQQEIERQRGEKCFPSSASIIAPFGTRSISSLRHADLVADANTFTSVIGWTHYHPHFQGWFLRIFVAGNITATVTHRHYLHTPRAIRAADQLRVGMLLRTPNGWRPITRIQTVWDHGLYNVQTRSGDIFVDGVLCTTYTKAVPPITAHALLAPVRLLAPFGLDLLSLIM